MTLTKVNQYIYVPRTCMVPVRRRFVIICIIPFNPTFPSQIATAAAAACSRIPSLSAAVPSVAFPLWRRAVSPSKARARCLHVATYALDHAELQTRGQWRRPVRVRVYARRALLLLGSRGVKIPRQRVRRPVRQSLSSQSTHSTSLLLAAVTGADTSHKPAVGFAAAATLCFHSPS